MAKPAETAETLERRQLIASLLQAARLKAGKSKQDCASAMGVTSGIYASYEEARRDVTLPELELFAHYLKLSVQSFFEQPERLIEEEPQIPTHKVLELRQRIVGALLRQARTEKDRSVKELAEQLGVSAHVISDYELGRKPIPLPQLIVAAEMLGLSINYFLDEGVGVIGEQELLRSQFDKFGDLPDDLRKFVVNPTNVSYLRVAQRLSDLTTVELRNLAAAILDITY